MTDFDPRRLPDRVELTELNDDERFQLLQSDSFCIIPWVHLHAHPDGRAFPCCLADMEHPLGNLREQSVRELWNSDEYRLLRRNMMADRKSAACRKCYERERAGFFSKRNSSNKQLGHHITQLRKTDTDGFVEQPHLVYWDIRFSNLCNLKCRSCGVLFSSSWHSDHEAMYGPSELPKFMHTGKDPEDLWSQLEEHVDHLEKVTFGGGEPLMMEEHYRLLKLLDERGLHHVKLIYHTNLSVTGYKDQDVLALWNRFSDVHVGASLDASYERANVMRHGTKWERVENNRRRMLEVCPGVDFYVAPTLGLLNSLHLPDFHQDWVERGLIRASELSLTVLLEPPWLRLDVLPVELKNQVAVRYEQHIDWLAAHGGNDEVMQSYQNALHFMQAGQRDQELPRFVRWSQKLDQLRNEDTRATFPELDLLWQQASDAPSTRIDP